MSQAAVATRIAEHLQHGDLVYIADSEQTAVALAAAVSAAAPQAAVVLIPASDALPGEEAPASPGNAGARVAALRQIRGKVQGTCQKPCVVLASAEAIARRYAPPNAFDPAPPVLGVGDMLDLESFESDCEALGYVIDDRVDEPGEVAVRGNVADVFPADRTLPVRIEAGDGRIVSLRSFDPVDQRSLDDLTAVEIGRVAEPSAVGGVTLLAHCPAGAALVLENKVASRHRGLLALAADVTRHGRVPADMIGEEEWRAATTGHDRLDWATDDIGAISRFVEERAPLGALSRFVVPLLERDARLILLGSDRDLRFLRPRIAKKLKRDCIMLASWADVAALPSGAFAALEMTCDRGFVRDKIIAVTAADLLGSRAEAEAGSVDQENGFDGLGDLRCGDVVVHEDHGIAVISGIEPLPLLEGSAQDAIALEFAGAARRLVPVSDAGRIWRYGADPEAVALDKLDGSSWIKRRETLDGELAETAKALIALPHQRAARTVPAIAADPDVYERFVAGFPYSETADQTRAIDAIRSDLASGTAMDRLVIGDVGYGKTEVALRAAAFAALAGGQVVLAAPTTVLVRQHYELFRARFEGTGVTVAMLSSSSTPAEKRAALAGLADGSIGIVVGTSAVAGKSVRYRSLQLVIIDEEQRFGAAHKARLRALHSGHFLALSATPIPRTLQNALVGLQQLSVIATPPARRQPIRTVVSDWDDKSVRAALLRERARRGQSFVVVPRIADMAAIEAKLGQLTPELTVVCAHGKLSAAELDTVMTEFADGRGDVLLATNIIEAGLDVPRANTMIVWRADRFGLSQLHQLRGRVGRGSRRGQIMLLTDAGHPISEATAKRLRTLEALDRLGAGFAISARDLDLRGGGDLLGDSQTGHMKLVGVELYQHMLEAALREARGETSALPAPDLRLGVHGALPESWIPEVDLRLQLYVRLARLTDLAVLANFEEELEDRFGAMPAETQVSLSVARVRLLAQMLGFERIDAGRAAIALNPRGAPPKSSPHPSAQLVDGRFLVREKMSDPHARLARVEEILLEMVEFDAVPDSEAVGRKRVMA